MRILNKQDDVSGDLLITLSALERPQRTTWYLAILIVHVFMIRAELWTHRLTRALLDFHWCLPGRGSARGSPWCHSASAPRLMWLPSQKSLSDCGDQIAMLVPSASPSATPMNSPSLHISLFPSLPPSLSLSLAVLVSLWVFLLSQVTLLWYHAQWSQTNHSHFPGSFLHCVSHLFFWTWDCLSCLVWKVGREGKKTFTSCWISESAEVFSLSLSLLYSPWFSMFPLRRARPGLVQWLCQLKNPFSYWASSSKGSYSVHTEHREPYKWFVYKISVALKALLAFLSARIPAAPLTTQEG